MCLIFLVAVYVAVLCLFQWQNLSKSVMGLFTDVVLSYLSVFNFSGSCLCGCLLLFMWLFTAVYVAVLSSFFIFYLFLFVWLTKVDII